MQIIDIEVPEPTAVVFPAGVSQTLIDKTLRPLYEHLYQHLDATTVRYPHIEFNLAKAKALILIESLTTLELRELKNIGYGKGKISDAEWNKSKETKPVMIFLWLFPCFANLILNVHLLADIVIKSTEYHLGSSIDATNFIRAKQLIDAVNRDRWDRHQTPNEKQSGVSNLGGVSEALLEKALGSLIDNQNFFRTTNQKIQSYGDFVLMCLPNNLWLSVKSNFARERLLASGYTTDIIGVGFFTSKKEFTSRSKIRNFQRVGFLSMYLPDIPISEEQVANGQNTYDEVMEYYREPGRSPPLNINGTNFIRPLSGLVTDIKGLLATGNIANRTTLDF